MEKKSELSLITWNNTLLGNLKLKRTSFLKPQCKSYYEILKLTTLSQVTCKTNSFISVSKGLWDYILSVLLNELLLNLFCCAY